MTPKYCVDTVRSHTNWTNFLLVALLAMILLSTPVMAAPTGGSGGDKSAYLGILDNLYQIVYDTLQYAGLATLVIGAIVWFTARRSSQRAETGMWLIIGGISMTVFYFGLGAFIAVIEWIAS